MTTSFVPANVIWSPNLKYKIGSKDYAVNWWEDDAFFFYPKLLVSAYFGIKDKNFRKTYGIPSHVTFIADSGGFQNMTQNANLNPLQVLEWQEQNADIGLIFDLPILGSDSEIRKEEKQKLTVENAVLAVNNRNPESKMKLYGVMQGHTLEEQRRMFQMYKERGLLDKLDGMAIGGLVPIAGNLTKLVEVLSIYFELMRDFKKPLHVFGLSGTSSILLINYLAARYGRDNVSYDSSSYGGGALRRETIHLWSKFKINFGKDDVITLEEFPFPSPITDAVDIQELKGTSSTIAFMLALHNLYHYIEYAGTIEKMRKDISFLTEFIKFYNKKLADALPIIDRCYTQGLDTFTRKQRTFGEF